MPWIADLILLSALWGGSFLLMRLGALEFGAMGTAFLRVALAAAMLLALLALRRELHVLRRHWRPALSIGLLNSGLPFALFSFAVLSIPTGLTAILNATAPIWGALVAALWLHEKLPAPRAAGLAIGVAGVALISWDKVAAGPGAAAWAVLAVLAATLCYGLSASFTKRWLPGVPPLATAAGSQLGATIGLAIPAAFLMPPLTGAGAPGLKAWLAVTALAALCTALAYVLYFRIIERAGPQRALTVTFLVPVFGVAYGALFLGERLDEHVLLGAAVILVGTALAVGLADGTKRAAAASKVKRA
ncbi:DMT family transporter [Aquabacterium humicola]|uniref:DMT family transporter n=1 Tax=Aquabacterium humicola TaxID=3237377 RepID=UPI002542CC66|nr:DMT family transporter [Rubrivivax pictus]